MLGDIEDSLKRCSHQQLLGKDKSKLWNIFHACIMSDIIKVLKKKTSLCKDGEKNLGAADGNVKITQKSNIL